MSSNLHLALIAALMSVPMDTQKASNDELDAIMALLQPDTHEPVTAEERIICTNILKGLCASTATLEDVYNAFRTVDALRNQTANIVSRERRTYFMNLMEMIQNLTLLRFTEQELDAWVEATDDDGIPKS